MPFLTSIFKVHRFVAGGFGLSLLLAPDAVNEAFAKGRIMPTEERLTLQSWACFMVGIAGIVHCAASFPVDAQRGVAKSLLVCFVSITVLYGKALMVDLKDAAADYRLGFGFTGSIFAVLAVAYGVALMRPAGRKVD